MRSSLDTAGRSRAASVQARWVTVGCRRFSARQRRDNGRIDYPSENAPTGSNNGTIAGLWWRGKALQPQLDVTECRPCAQSLRLRPVPIGNEQNYEDDQEIKGQSERGSAGGGRRSGEACRGGAQTGAPGEGPVQASSQSLETSQEGCQTGPQAGQGSSERTESKGQSARQAPGESREGS